MSKLVLRGAAVLGAVGGLAAIGYGLLTLGSRPVDPAAGSIYFRVESGDTLSLALRRAESAGLVRSAAAAGILARLSGAEAIVQEGTYELSAAMSGGEIAKALVTQKPLSRMVLIREGLWTERLSQLLEEQSVCSAKDFLAEVATPERSRASVSFPLPPNSLEGYLFPDTYDLPPLYGARRTVRRMLATFEAKVYEPLGRPAAETLHRLVIIGSLVELEAEKDAERVKIAGVIENRIKQKMKLQIDATVNYALKSMRKLTFKDYEFEHPYNTYRIVGLPPGPICSPGFASISAATRPEKHDYLFYVAKPDGFHLFAKTYEEHLANIEAVKKLKGGGRAQEGN